MLAMVVNDCAGCLTLNGVWATIASMLAPTGGMGFQGGGAETQKPAFAGFCEIQNRDPEFEIGAQKKTRTSTTVRSPAPEAGVSTNFTIWAFIASVAAVDVAHYTESFLICKPLIWF